MEFTLGQKVIVQGGPPDHGRFTGKVIETGPVKIVVQPDDPALREWFTQGYDIGKAHWGQAVIPA